jgi:glycosyltransferase involved in cell wall biosynthesis
VSALARAIERLAEDPGLRAEMGAVSHRIARTEFAEDIVLEATINTYQLHMGEPELELATA